jgi:hypothetical protein
MTSLLKMAQLVWYRGAINEEKNRVGDLTMKKVK